MVILLLLKRITSSFSGYLYFDFGENALLLTRSPTRRVLSFPDNIRNCTVDDPVPLITCGMLWHIVQLKRIIINYVIRLRFESQI